MNWIDTLKESTRIQGIIEDAVVGIVLGDIAIDDIDWRIARITDDTIQGAVVFSKPNEAARTVENTTVNRGGCIISFGAYQEESTNTGMNFEGKPPRSRIVVDVKQA